MDSVLDKNPYAGIFVVGDFNRFNFRILSNNFNLRQLVKAPTRGSATLDLILTNLFEHYSKPDILAGIGLSDHKSIFIRPLNSSLAFLQKKSLLSVIEAYTEINSIELATRINNKLLTTNNSLPPLLPVVNSKSDYETAEEIALKYWISPEDVYKRLSNLKRGKASAPDNLPPWIIKHIAMELSSPVPLIFNYSIQERTVQNAWKVADII
jgi:hypothetical protein